MEREQALNLVKEHLSNKNLRKHVYAVEALMREFAEKLGYDVDEWGLAGLLHDLDYELTLKDEDKHTFITLDWLREIGGVNENVLHAIQAHAGHVDRTSEMDKAIYCCDPTSGFIVACALMHPSKSLSGLTSEFMLKRFKEKRFAAGANRDQMQACSELGYDLEEFLMISRDAMVKISKDLGL